MEFKPVLLWSDILLFVLLGLTLSGAYASWRSEPMRRQWQRLGRNAAGMAAAMVLSFFIVVGVLDSLHYRARLPAQGDTAPVYGVEVLSVLDALLMPLKTNSEKTYSAPLAMRLFAKEAVEGEVGRDFPRLRYGGAHLGDDEENHGWDVAVQVLGGLGASMAIWLALAWRLRGGGPGRAAVRWSLLLLCLAAGPTIALAAHYHVLGTDKVGQDVLYLALKSIRTGLLIGTLTTLVTLPLAVLLGILAGYAGGWLDDAIQYVYTTLNSIPGVLLIAAAVLMMQVVIDTHPDWFSTAAERADARLLALCFILGMTSWTGLARLLRGETLKLRELDYVQAAQAFGVSRRAIMLRHILPNVSHIVLIALVMDFSSLVLAEAVLSYVGIGVDPTTISFGTMINAARMELAREPMVWWSLVAAFSFMFALVLAANLFADAVRDAFDPRAAQ
ncbi:MAG: ABC transporter permease [Rhodocyclaceae bacterium]|nr:ABC transporter permease [Rhodocyclaceae bacterium]